MPYSFHVSQRVSYDGQLCTVRYIGPVKGTAGDWLGVEWDDGDRGKHAGEHGGVKYFECASRHPAPASFVRPGRPTDKPFDFIDAVKQKYASGLVSSIFSAQLNKTADTIKISGKEVKEVGFEKVRKQLANLKQLRIVVVDTARISHSSLAQTRDIAESIPNVVELDVSRNLFETWQEITGICEQLTRLISLRVDGNRFAAIQSGLDVVHFGVAPFNCIKMLSLNDTLVPWDHVGNIARSLPCLSTLSASGNEYIELTDAELPNSIECVHLERNYFKTLESVKSMGQLRSLRNLNLRENPIASVSNEQAWSSSRFRFTFPESLMELNVPFCSISDWALIDGLAQICPGLTSLRVSHNPLYESLVGADGKPLTPDDGYMLTIARLGRLARLNFSTITPKDRLNAELYYLAQINTELSTTTADFKSKVIARHPRYHELCQTYDDSGDQKYNGPLFQVDPHSLAAALVTVHFKLDSALTQKANYGNPSDLNRPRQSGEWKREIPGSYNVYKIVGLVAKHFALMPMSIQLHLDRPNDDDSPPDTDSDQLSDGSSDDNTKAAMNRQTRPLQQLGPLLTPLTRPLDTWVDDREATLWISQN